MRVVLVGCVPPPVTGEAAANAFAVQCLRDAGADVAVVDTTLAAHQHRPGRLSPGKLFRQLAVYLQMGRLVARDVLYMVPGQSPAGVLRQLPFLLLARVLRLRLVLHVHGGGFRQAVEGVRPRALGMLARRWYSGAERVIVLAESLRDQALDGPSEVVLLDNFHAFDGSEAPAVPDVGPDDGAGSAHRVNVLFLSNLIAEKGPLDTIAAVAVANADGGRFDLRVAGGGEARMVDAVRAACSRSGAEFVGFVSGAEKADLLAWADVVVLPSRYPVEGQPISVIEAMAAGAYPILSDQGGMAEMLVAHDAGCVLEDVSIAALAEALAAYAALPAAERTALRGTIAEGARSRYDPERFRHGLCAAVLRW